MYYVITFWKTFNPLPPPDIVLQIAIVSKLQSFDFETPSAEYVNDPLCHWNRDSCGRIIILHGIISRTTKSGVGIVNACTTYREFYHLQRY